MRKELLLFSLIFLLLVSGVCAQDTDNGDDSLEDTVGELRGVGKEVADTSELKKKSDEVLTKEIEIPENFQLIARVMFGLKADDPVDLQTFVVLIGLWVILLLLIKNILEIVPMFGEGLKAWIGGVVITILIAITGAIRDMAEFFFGLGNLFGFLEEQGLLRFVFVLILLAVSFYVIFKLIKLFKSKQDDEQATSVGEDLGFMARVARTFRRVRGND